MAAKKDKTLDERKAVSKRLRERAAKLPKEADALAKEIERLRRRSKGATDAGNRR